MDLTPIFRIEYFLDAIINGTTPPEPIFRKEFFLAKIGGADVETPEPIFRVEKYLAKIGGDDVEIPDPVFREEFWLAKKCGANVVTPEPVFRLEYFLEEWVNGSAPAYQSVTGKIVSFLTQRAAPLKIEADLEPIQSGSGDPSPENIRPISGHTGAAVYVSNDNLLDLDRTIGTPSPADGAASTSPRVMDTEHYYVGLRPDNLYYPSNVSSYSVSDNSVFIKGANNAYGVGFPVSVVPNTKYTISGTASANPYLGIGFYDRNWNYLSALNSNTASYTFTTPSNAAYATIVLRSTDTTNGTTWTDVMLNLGPTASAYEAYSGTTVTISFGQTVYGGELTVNEDGTGSVVAEYGLFAMPHDKNWIINQNGYGSYISFSTIGLSNVKAVPSDTPNRTIVRTSWCKMNALKTSEIGWSATNNSAEPQFVVSYDDYVMINIGINTPTNTQINQFIEDNGLALCYPLATPITIPLTPGQVEALQGNNTVWVDDSDEIKVTYRSN